MANAISSGDYAFCRKPHEPLPPRARALCKHASAIPSCEGFAAACARAEQTREAPPWSEAWAERLAAIVRMLATGARVAIWALVAAIAAAAVFVVLRAIGHRRRAAAVRPEEAAILPAPRVDAEQADAETLLARAHDHARRGRAREAMELYLAASLRALHERGAIRVTRDLTNGECVLACADPTVRPALAVLAGDVDGVQFGGELAAPERVSRAASTATSLVRGAAAVVGLLLLVGACGCSGIHLPGRARGDDPSGEEIWADVLKRQGWEVTRLGGALSSMPMPRPGSAPVVVVDADRVDMDDDTREHLGAWVDAGGTLVLAGDPESWPALFRPVRRGRRTGTGRDLRGLRARSSSTRSSSRRGRWAACRPRR